MRLLLRRLRGAFGNAVVWGSTWFLVGLVSLIGWGLLSYQIPAEEWATLHFWRTMLEAAGFLAAIGAGTGAAFSAFVAANFRRGTLEDLQPARFAFGGGLVATLVVLVILYLTGAGQDFLLRPLVWTALVGGTTGYTSLKLAQRSLPASEHGPEQFVSNSKALPARS